MSCMRGLRVPRERGGLRGLLRSEFTLLGVLSVGGRGRAQRLIVCGVMVSVDVRIAKVDEFIAQLWKIHKEVKTEGFVQVRRKHAFIVEASRAAGSRGMNGEHVESIPRLVPLGLYDP